MIWSPISNPSVFECPAVRFHHVASKVIGMDRPANRRFEIASFSALEVDTKIALRTPACQSADLFNGRPGREATSYGMEEQTAIAQLMSVGHFAS